MILHLPVELIKIIEEFLSCEDRCALYHTGILRYPDFPCTLFSYYNEKICMYHEKARYEIVKDYKKKPIVHTRYTTITSYDVLKSICVIS